jgi:pyruvate kinase
LQYCILSETCIHTTHRAGDIIQVDDGDLKVQVTEVLSPTSVRGRALNPHKLREMALVHVKGAFKHEEAVLSARDKVDIRFAAQNQVTFVSVPFVRSAADVLAVSCCCFGVVCAVLSSADSSIAQSALHWLCALDAIAAAV